MYCCSSSGEAGPITRLFPFSAASSLTSLSTIWSPTVMMLSPRFQSITNPSSLLTKQGSLQVQGDHGYAFQMILDIFCDTDSFTMVEKHLKTCWSLCFVTGGQKLSTCIFAVSQILSAAGHYFTVLTHLMVSPSLTRRVWGLVTNTGVSQCLISLSASFSWMSP